MYLGAIKVRLRTAASGSALAIAITPWSTTANISYVWIPRRRYSIRSELCHQFIPMRGGENNQMG